MKNSSPPSLLRLQTCFSVARSISIAYTCTYKICSDARLNFVLTHNPARRLRFVYKKNMNVDTKVHLAHILYIQARKSCWRKHNFALYFR